MKDEELLTDAHDRALSYLSAAPARRVFPDRAALDNLAAFDEALSAAGRPGDDTIALLDRAGSPATVVSNGPNYYGFVVGGTMPVARAADTIMSAWDQTASGFVTSPAAEAIEKAAGRWVLDLLDLPRAASLFFGTSSGSCAIALLAAARHRLLANAGWDVERDGLTGAPQLRVVVSEKIHVTVLKALRLLGFGDAQIVRAPVDHFGRVDPACLPPVDSRTILCLQAGEVNTGEFDPFDRIIPWAKAAGAWVHVDGAFGLWARATRDRRHLTAGVDAADSWAVDGHKWLNTPYDGAIGICRDRDALHAAMNADAVYAPGSADTPTNQGIEFSRRARGVPVWAVLRTMGRDGLDRFFTASCDLAAGLGDALRDAGFEVLNPVCLNQVLVRLDTDERTQAIIDRVAGDGLVWFGATRWQDRVAFRLSVANWQTEARHIEFLVGLLRAAKQELDNSV